MYRIIVVDDEAVITTQLEEHLTSLGYEVVGAASSGEEAVMLAKELKPDLIIMDIVMPGKINGIIAAEKIQHEIIIPVIFLTAYTDDKYIQKAKNIFPIGYIVKPFKEEELKAIIEIGIYKAEMEKKLRKSEEKFSSFMNTATDLMYITDAHGYLTYVNASMSQALGYSPKELKGMQISQILSLEIQNNFKINREELITSGKLFKESIWITKEGKQIHGEIRLNAIYDNNCNYTGSRGVFRNITKRKQVEESLRESEAKYRRLSENSPAVVYQFIMTPEGAFTFPYVSHVVAATMGISAEDAMKDSSQLLDMVHPEDKEMFREGIIKSAESLESFPLTFRCLKDGEVIWIEARGTPTPLADGGMLWDGFFLDITERKHVEEESKINRQRLRMLNKIIQHDLTNDFIVIESAVYVFKENSNADMLDEIEKRVKKSLATIENYREYESFIDSNAELKELNVNELINEIIYEFPTVKFNVEGSGYVFADEALFSVFKNLTTNSITHGNSSMINIIITSHENFIEIRFEDNGQGIPKDIKDKIFDEGFFYGEKGHSGIGLFIIKNIIESYGGFVSYEDNQPDGAVFVIKLRKVLKQRL